MGGEAFIAKKQGGKPNEKLYPTCQRETSGINSVFSSTKKMFVLHRDKDFSRNRKLPFETMIKLILEMTGNTLDHELRRYLHLFSGRYLSVFLSYNKKREDDHFFNVSSPLGVALFLSPA